MPQSPNRSTLQRTVEDDTCQVCPAQSKDGPGTYVAGRYPSQAPPDNPDHLFQYAKDNESIYKEDIVAWYSLGFTHITKPEDYPIMPVAKVAVNFAPRGFFIKSPATGYATIESTSAQ